MSDVPDPYRGLCASTYDALVPPDAVGDVDFFRTLVADGGQPALEIGCGTGRLLLRYLEEGLAVDGADISAEMLDCCTSKGRERGLNPRLYHQAMQDLQIAHRYRTIFVPYFSFQLLTRDDDIGAALRGFHRHLEPDGRLAVPLFFPFEDDVGQEPAPADEWRLRRRADDGAGGEIRCWELATYDLRAQLKQATLRFETLDRDGAVTRSEERSIGIRWHTQEQFASLLDEAGFAATRVFSGHGTTAAKPRDSQFTFVAQAGTAT